jgi:hypothetical protein
MLINKNRRKKFLIKRKNQYKLNTNKLKKKDTVCTREKFLFILKSKLKELNLKQNKDTVNTLKNLM